SISVSWSRASRPTFSPLSPYTTLFRSRRDRGGVPYLPQVGQPAGGAPHPATPLGEGRHRVPGPGVAGGGRARAYRIGPGPAAGTDRKSTRLNSSHVKISYAVFCLKKKK